MTSQKHIEDLLDKSKYFCLAPWVHLHVTGLGVMSSCAMSEQGPFDSGYGSLNEARFHEIWQGEQIRRFRLKMLSDEPIDRCVNCYGSRLGHWTLRNEINSHYRHHASWAAGTDDAGHAPAAEPVFWDIRFSNICNLKCRSCIDVSSTGWYSDAKALGYLNVRGNGKALLGINDPSILLRDLEPYLPHLEGIRFAGGEPLLMQENFRLISELDQLRRHDVRIEYETNMTRLHNDKYDILSIWKNFTNLLLSISLDGLGAKCEYLRKGLRWRSVLQNIEDIKRRCPNASVRINYTISAYNLLHFCEFHREMVERGYISADQIQLICATEPRFVSMKVLPKGIKARATRMLMDHIRWLRRQPPFDTSSGLRRCADTFLQWLTCLRQLNADDWSTLLPEFADYTEKLDILRDEDCLSVFPELTSVFRDDRPYLLTR